MTLAAELLERRAKRKVVAFLTEFDSDAESIVEVRLVHAHFWSLIYDGSIAAVDHQTALDVEHELMTCDKRISDVLQGWRPESLAWTKPAGGDV